MTLRGYGKIIKRQLDCTEKDALEVEALMRVDRKTLDGLTQKEFNSLTRTAAIALRQLRAEDSGWTLGPFEGGAHE